MITVSCTLCKFFAPNLQDPNGGGTCHLHNPASIFIGVTPQGPQLLIDVWPPVSKRGWCADGVPGISAESVAVGQAALDKSNHGKS